MSKLILKEGHKVIAILAIATIFSYLFICDTFATIVLAATLFSLYVFRTTNRHIFANTDNVLAPTDGKVIAIDKFENKQKIYCKVNLCDSHVVKAPIDAQMKIKKQKHGLNLSPSSCKGKLLNEQVVIKFDNIKLKLISGLCNISMEKLESRDIIQGENICVFLDGIAEITIKDNCDLLVNIGDKLTAGQTLLFKK